MSATSPSDVPSTCQAVPGAQFTLNVGGTVNLLNAMAAAGAPPGNFTLGSLQLEVGVQTCNPAVAAAISRRQDYARLEENFHFLRAQTGVHLHAESAGNPVHHGLGVAPADGLNLLLIFGQGLGIPSFRVERVAMLEGLARTEVG